MSIRSCLIALLTMGLLSPAALAGEAFSAKGRLTWSMTAGNTDTTDLDSQLNLIMKTSKFLNELDVSYNYGSVSGEKTRERTDVSLNIGWRFFSRLVLSGLIRAQTDIFGGYDSKFFFGPEVKIIPVDRKNIKWDLSVGPGLMLEKPVTGSKYGKSFSILAHSRLFWAITRRIHLTTEIEALYSSSNTIMTAIGTLEFPVIGSLGVGVDARGSYNTNPPEDIQPWDLKTGAFLSFSF